LLLESFCMTWRDELLPDEDPWSRSSQRHVTGSALVVHPPTRRVLLRWHPRYGFWNHVGGHADDGEEDPLVTALREAVEETGLRDVHVWPAGTDDEPVVTSTVPVPASEAKGEPAHEHIDVCWLLATDDPDATVEEEATATLRWLSVAEARELVDANDHVQDLLDAYEARL
jgi:8-oxo-dGTP pyrophosphatase MutT (NUDIX family)